MSSLSRRRLLRILLGTPLVAIVGCGGDSETFPSLVPPPDLVLEGDETQLANLVKQQLPRLKQLAQNPGTSLRIGIPNGRGMEVLAFSLVDNGAKNYRHLRVVRESTGEAVNLLWGMKGLLPSIRVADDKGNTISRNGRLLEIGFSDVSKSKGRQALDWIAIGVKVAAVAFALWLGAQIGRAILGAQSLSWLSTRWCWACLSPALAVISPAIEWVLRNITLQDVENFFGQLVNDIIRLFTEISQMLTQWLGS
jgi:hypothetical protein